LVEDNRLIMSDLEEVACHDNANVSNAHRYIQREKGNARTLPSGFSALHPIYSGAYS
jgi:hypothetical protein